MRGHPRAFTVFRLPLAGRSTGAAYGLRLTRRGHSRDSRAKHFLTYAHLRNWHRDILAFKNMPAKLEKVLPVVNDCKTCSPCPLPRVLASGNAWDSVDQLQDVLCPFERRHEVNLDEERLRFCTPTLFRNPLRLRDFRRINLVQRSSYKTSFRVRRGFAAASLETSLSFISLERRMSESLWCSRLTESQSVAVRIRVYPFDLDTLTQRTLERTRFPRITFLNGEWNTVR